MSDAKGTTSSETVTEILLNAADASRFLAEAAARSQATEEPSECLLTSEQVAERLAVTLDWVYRHSKSLPFRVPLDVEDHPGKKARKKAREGRLVRYSERGLNRWIASQERRGRR